jgi:hypothetical protein
MGFGSASTVAPWQELYNIQLMSAMQPWVKPTSDKLAQFSDQPQSTYQPMANWDQYIQQKYTAPAQYSLKQKLADLSSSPEYFSYGKQYRDMLAMNQMNQGLGQNVMGEMGQERTLQYQGQANALARQLQSLGIEGQDIMAPLKVRAIENTARPTTLFESIFGG